MMTKTKKGKALMKYLQENLGNLFYADREGHVYLIKKTEYSVDRIDNNLYLDLKNEDNAKHIPIIDGKTLKLDDLEGDV